MKHLKYFLQFIIILILFLIFKLIGLKFSTKFSGNLFRFIGPLFRSNKISNQNLAFAFPNMDEAEKKKSFEKYGLIMVVFC